MDEKIFNEAITPRKQCDVVYPSNQNLQFIYLFNYDSLFIRFFLYFKKILGFNSYIYIIIDYG